MINIEYDAIQFPKRYGSKLMNKNTLNFSQLELIWASITVGKSSIKDVVKYGYYSINEMMFRTSMLCSTLAISGSTNELIKTALFKGLDPSEKGAISYFQGLVLAKLFASKLLDTPYLIHLDNFNGPLKSMPNRRSKPDLIGLNKRMDWIIFEAKGSSCKLNKATLLKAKKQTRSIRRINGQFPVLRVASMSYYDNDALKVILEDPDDFSEDAIDIDLDFESYIKFYYHNILSLINSTEANHLETEVNGQTYKLAQLPFFSLLDNPQNIFIGLNSKILDFINQDKDSSKESRDSLVEKLLTSVSFSVDDIYNENIYIGSDGVIIYVN